jgi:hypothetical protein
VKPSRSVVVALTFTAQPGPVRGKPRLLPDQHAVCVHQLPARLSHLPVGLAQQLERRYAAEALVSRREQAADVAETGGAEQRVDQRMRDDVAVRVAR